MIDTKIIFLAGQKSDCKNNIYCRGHLNVDVYKNGGNHRQIIFLWSFLIIFLNKIYVWELKSRIVDILNLWIKNSSIQLSFMLNNCYTIKYRQEIETNCEM